MKWKRGFLPLHDGRWSYGAVSPDHTRGWYLTDELDFTAIRTYDTRHDENDGWPMDISDFFTTKLICLLFEAP